MSGDRAVLRRAGLALAVWCSVIWIGWPATSVVSASRAHDIEAGITPRFAMSALSWPDSVGTSDTSELPLPVVCALACARTAAECGAA